MDSIVTRYYNSVNDLKHDTTIKANMVLKTLGYYNKNDGGNATYLVRELAESDIEDSATLFLCNNLVAYLFVTSHRISMPQLGYLPNKVNQDCHDSIATYVRICKRDNCKYELFFPAGRWFFSETNIENGRRGVVLTGVSSQVATDLRLGESAIMPFRESQEYIWNFGYSDKTTEITGGNMVKGFTISTGWGKDTPYLKKFCKVGIMLTKCCYSDFDSLYFHYFNGTGLMIKEGWENRWGYLNFRCVGYIAKDRTYSCIEFRKHPVRQTPSAVSANYFDYINFEGFSVNGIYFEEGCNAVHDEFNNIQVEWKHYEAYENGITVTYETDKKEWDDKSEDIEHIYLIKGCAGANYNPLMFNNISISGGNECTYTIKWTDEDGTEHTRYKRRSGVFGQEESYKKTKYGLRVMASNVSCLGNLPIYHSVQGALSGTYIKVSSHHGGCIPAKCKNHEMRLVNVMDSEKDFMTNKKGMKLIFPRNLYSACNNSKIGTYLQGSYDNDNLALMHGYVSYPIDASKIVKVRLYVDYNLNEISSKGISIYCVAHGVEKDYAAGYLISFKKSEFEIGKYPLKEFFEYTIPYKNLPLTGLDFEIRINKNTKVYLDCLEQSEEKKVLTYNQLNSRIVSSSPAGVTVFCTDRREKVEDSLGVLVYSTGKGFKSFNGTQLSKLLI